MRRITTYIHERAAWPVFTWDSDALAGALAYARHKQGRLLGKMEALGFELTPSTAQQFRDRVQADLALYAPLVREGRVSRL